MIETKLETLDAKVRSPLTEDQIRKIEGRIGSSLPDAYRKMLATFGGPSFKDVFYQDLKASCPVRFGWFFDYDELSDALESYSDSIPDNMIPIGDDGGCNLYCLGITGKNQGKVYFHDHSIGWQSDAETIERNGEDVPDNIRYQTVNQIGESFEEFIDGMFHHE